MSGPDPVARAQWSARHGGVDPSGSAWVSGWVALTDRCARPFERAGVGADAVTGLGVLVTATVPTVASAGAGWPLLAVPVVVAAAVLDGVDGAIASRTGTTSRWGQVLDSTADRVADLLLVLTLWVLGAPGWLAVASGVLVLLHESVRSSAQAAGMTGPGAVTVAERPTRVVVASFALLLCGLVWCAEQVGVRVAGLDAPLVASAVASIGVAFAVAGLGQLVAAVRRSLSGQGEA